MISQCKNAKIHIAAADDKKLSYNCIAKIRCLKCLFINVKIPLSQLQSRLHVVHQLIEPLAGPHGHLSHSGVGMVVATNIYTGSLTVHQLLSNHSLRVFQCLGQRDPSRILCSQTFSPVQSYIKVATTIVNFFPLSPQPSIQSPPPSLPPPRIPPPRIPPPPQIKPSNPMQANPSKPNKAPDPGIPNKKEGPPPPPLLFPLAPPPVPLPAEECLSADGEVGECLSAQDCGLSNGLMSGLCHQGMDQSAYPRVCCTYPADCGFTT